jgi:hypothetical protein
MNAENTLAHANDTTTKATGATDGAGKAKEPSPIDLELSAIGASPDRNPHRELQAVPPGNLLVEVYGGHTPNDSLGYIADELQMISGAFDGDCWDPSIPSGALYALAGRVRVLGEMLDRQRNALLGRIEELETERLEALPGGRHQRCRGNGLWDQSRSSGQGEGSHTQGREDVTHRDDVLSSSRAGYGTVAGALAECQRLLTAVNGGGVVVDAELEKLRDELGKALHEMLYLDQQLHEAFLEPTKGEEAPQSSA